MTKRAVGPGGKCCNDPESCDVGCFTGKLDYLPEPVDVPRPEPEDDEDDLDLFDEEVDE